MRDTPWDAIGLAIGAVLLAAMAWGWTHAIHQRHKSPSVTEPWQHVTERFPISDHFKQAPEIPAAILQAVIRANPFSPQRRLAPVSPTPSAEIERPPPPPSPQFIYKGRLLMGAKQRAILEEVTSKKTHFLQVGQEVAGFQVLEIADNQVVLKHSQTNEELVVSLTPKARP